MQNTQMYIVTVFVLIPYFPSWAMFKDSPQVAQFYNPFTSQKRHELTKIYMQTLMDGIREVITLMVFIAP